MAETALREPTPHSLPTFALMAASGAAALGYEIVWTQQHALWLGHESAAVLAILAAFFGGLGLGALWLGPPIEKSTRPGRVYALCEATIAGWSLLLAFAMPHASGWLLALVGVQPAPAWQWLVTFGGTLLLLLPATAAMGATMPAMARMLAGDAAPGAIPRLPIGALYASNTFGAVAGVVFAAFWLVPTFGLLRTALACAALNVTCALLALRFLDRTVAPAATPTAISAEGAAPLPPGGPALASLALSGLLGIGYEVLGVRVLSQVAENTVYTFALLLAVYLVGTALGAAVYQRWLAQRVATRVLREKLLITTAGTVLIGMLGMAAARAVKPAVLGAVGAVPAFGTAGASSMAPALLAETTIAVAAFLLPAMAMGALFSHLCAVARAAGTTLGQSLGVNTLGAALAPLCIGVWLVPAIGMTNTGLAMALGYLALAAPAAWRTPGFLGTAAATLASLAWAPSLAFVDMPAGGRVLRLDQGPTATVSIVEDADGISRLHIDNRQQEGSSGTRFSDARQALLPLLLHPAPRQALFLGLGTGITAASAARDPALEVDAVELLPEVIAASAHFRRILDDGAPTSRLHLLRADARRFVRTATRHYDVIVADNFHPARSGSSALYTVEHFTAVRARLAPDGIFCQWLPLHQLDLDTLRSVVRSFLEAYPGASAMLATNSLETPVLGLVGRGNDRGFRVDDVRRRLALIGVPGGMEPYGFDDEFAVLGSFVAGPAALKRFAGEAPLNTDDHPVVAYRAPRITYAPDSLPRERLLALLDAVTIAPAELLAGPVATGWPDRLAAYWAARDRFIMAGRNVRPSGDVRRMLAQVREPLLSVLGISPDFRPAYDPLLRMAVGLASEDRPAARALLADLQRLQPARGEAALALDDLPLDRLDGRR